MSHTDVLLGLMLAYCAGDRFAKRALLDYLDENDDPRRDAVERENIDWVAVARGLCPHSNNAGHRILLQHYPEDKVVSGELGRWRYYVDCARFGADTIPEVVQAVRDARRNWLQGLFPEVDLSGTA